MPTRTISLTTELDAFVDEVVRSGTYQDADEVVRDAVRGLQARRHEDELKLTALRVQVEAGLAALAGGDVTEVGDDELDAVLDPVGGPLGRAAAKLQPLFAVPIMAPIPSTVARPLRLIADGS